MCIVPLRSSLCPGCQAPNRPSHSVALTGRSVWASCFWHAIIRGWALARGRQAIKGQRDSDLCLHIPPPPKSLLTLCLDCQFREPVELFLSGAARTTLSRTVTGVTTCYRHLPQTYSTELELHLMANSKSTASNNIEQNQILHFNFYSSGKLPLLSKSTAKRHHATVFIHLQFWGVKR